MENKTQQIITTNGSNEKLKSKSLLNEYKNTIYYPSSSKEWFSSVYNYNTLNNKSWIVNYTILYKILMGYCNIYRNRIKVYFKRRGRSKTRYSANKVYISQPELNNTNTTLSVILYTYNKRKLSNELHLRKLVTLSEMYEILVEKNIEYVVSHKNNLFSIIKNKTFSKKVKNSLLKGYVNTHKNRVLLALKNNYFLINEWNIAFLNVKGNLLDYFILKLKNEQFYKIPTTNIKLVKNLFKLKRNFFLITRDIIINKIKYNNYFLTLENLGVMSIIEKLYNKKIIIKLIEQKSIHLNSGIFSSAVMLKLRDRKNKAVRVLRRAIGYKVKTPDLHTLITFDDTVEKVNKNNILSTLKQQVVSGIRFEASGRLTKRLTAMRAVFKYRYKGSLKNIRSSFNNKSSTMLRGYVKSNSDYTIINSKTRNGSFGLKSWISSH